MNAPSPLRVRDQRVRGVDALFRLDRGEELRVLPERHRVLRDHEVRDAFLRRVLALAVHELPAWHVHELLPDLLRGPHPLREGAGFSRGLSHWCGTCFVRDDINVRAAGTRIFAARRVLAGYWWESYGPLAPAPMPTPFSRHD
jgi:hypothetical protein